MRKILLGTLNTRAIFIPENKKLDNLLKDFQRMKSHLAIVVDEYKFWFSFLEDVIEEIVILAMSLMMTMSTSLKLTKKLSFEGKINLKDFYRIIEINEEIFEMKKERLRPWFYS
jgi:Mg2+/Co2+ transporter CorB